MDKSKLFSRVEIEINTHCNRKNDVGEYCSYCPNSVLEPLPPKLIEENLYEKIVNELNALGFVGRLSFHFYGEPLLHPRVEFLINYTKINLSGAELVIYTNGDKLDDSKYKSIIEAGIDIIAIYNPRNKFPSRPKQKIINSINITNRGGLLANSSTFNLKCFAPTHRLVIGYNGDVLLCYEDARRQNIFGNVYKKTIKEIWFSTKFQKIRYDLSLGYRNLYSPCKYCNNKLHTDISQINVNYFNLDKE